MTEAADKAPLELVRQWLFKADNDLVAAGQLGSQDDPKLDAAIYHCQQSADLPLGDNEDKSKDGDKNSDAPNAS